MNKKELLQQEAKNYLLKGKLIKPTTELMIFIKKVSSSGMSRQMLVLGEGNIDITYSINELLGYSTKNDYVRVSGCGMDMAFWLANTITYHLYGNKKLKSFKGNGGSCLGWKAIY